MLCYVILWCIILIILRQVAFYFVILSFLPLLLSIIMYSVLKCVLYDHLLPSVPINWHHTYIPHIRSWIHIFLTFFLRLLFFPLFLCSSPPLFSTSLTFSSSYLLYPPLFHPSHDLPFSLLSSLLTPLLHFSSHSSPQPLFSLFSFISLLTPLLHLSFHSSPPPLFSLFSFTSLLTLLLLVCSYSPPSPLLSPPSSTSLLTDSL